MTENPVLHELELHDAMSQSHPHSLLLFRMHVATEVLRKVGGDINRLEHWLGAMHDDPGA